MSNETNNKPEIPIWLKVLVSFSTLIAFIAVGIYTWKFHYGLSPKQEVWGQFGDFIGGTLNPLFAFTALLALLYTITLQGKELKNSTDQLKKSAEALDQQNGVLLKQSFESTFFQLLSLYNEIIQDLHMEKIEYVDHTQTTMTLETRKVSYDDRHCLNQLQHELIKNYLSEVKNIKDKKRRIEEINSAYHKFYEKHGHLIGHYFRTIYNIIKIVDNSEINEEQKFVYTNILRAQLSKYELGLLFYNCLSHYGRLKMLPLVIKFNLLKHIEEDVILSKEDISLIKDSNKLLKKGTC